MTPVICLIYFLTYIFISLFIIFHLKMIIVIVRGIPNKVNPGRFSQFLKRSILKKRKSQFFITPVREDEIKIQFKEHKDGEKVYNFLNGYAYTQKGQQYILACTLMETDEEFNNLEIRDQLVLNRERSRSPIRRLQSSDELSEVNKAIELTKKKRVLIEEEKKLLLEQKKLQLLRKSIPTNMKELALLQNTCEKASIDTINTMLAEKTVKKKVTKSILATLIHKGGQKVFGQLAQAFYLNATSDNIHALRRSVNSTIRNRIKLLLTTKECSTIQQVVELYRENYPESSDTDFLMDLKKNLDKETSNGIEKPTSETIVNISINELSELESNIDIEKDLDDWVDDNSAETLTDTSLQEVTQNTV